MAIKGAQQQLEYGWGIYQKGSRGENLWNDMKRFAKSGGLPASYENPLHGLKQLAKSGKLDSTSAIQAFLLACELALPTKGLSHHVVLLTGESAGLLRSTDKTATTAMVTEALKRANL